MANETASVARLVLDSAFFNTINIPTVELFFQRSPGNGPGKRGIPGLDFQVEKNGALIQTKGVSAADGKVVMLLPGGAAQLQLLFGGAVVARYDVVLQTIGVRPVETKAGQQQRLRMLGYQIGHGGALKDGVTDDELPIEKITDAQAGMVFERSVLDFQVDLGTMPGNSTIVQPLTRETGV
jgi:hypothetical protein